MSNYSNKFIRTLYDEKFSIEIFHTISKSWLIDLPVQQSIPVGPVAQLSLPQRSVPTQSRWWSQSPSPSAQVESFLHFDQSTVSEFKRHILCSTLHSPLVQSESLMHDFVQQFREVLLAQFICPHIRDSSQSESVAQSPSPKVHCDSWLQVEADVEYSSRNPFLVSE